VKHKPVIFDGIAPTWLYAHLAAAVPHAAWVACGDARGGAIVVRAAKGASFAVGHEIAREHYQHLIEVPAGRHHAAEKASRSRAAAKVIAIVGPPHSGKSVFFLSVLPQALRSEVSPRAFSQNVFFLSSAPDGEGKWSQDVSAEQARVFRRKGPFTIAFAELIARGLENAAKIKRLVFTDCGGRIDGKQAYVWRHCTHAIIVSSNPSAVGEWAGALAAHDVEVLAVVDSVLIPVSRVQRGVHGPLRFTLGPLVRNTKPIPRLPKRVVRAILASSGLRKARRRSL
jgi:CRISPR-associated protein Csx3